MFTELKNTIEAADWIMYSLRWSYERLLEEIERCKDPENMEDPYYKDLLSEDLAKVEAYKHVEKAMKAFVKASV